MGQGTARPMPAQEQLGLDTISNALRERILMAQQLHQQLLVAQEQ